MVRRRAPKKLDPNNRPNYRIKQSQITKERIQRELEGKPAWKISPISAGYDRLWPLRDRAIPIGIPEDPAFTIPAGSDKRTGNQIAHSIHQQISDVTIDMMSPQRIQLVTRYYKKIFFTDVNHIYKFTPSQLLQMLFLFLKNFSDSNCKKKSIYLFCSCKLDTQKRCPVVFAIHYDVDNNVYYVRPTKDVEHSHDFEVAMDRIKSLGFGTLKVTGKILTTGGIMRRINMLSRKARFGIHVDIPEDSRFSMEFTPELESKDIVSKLRQLVASMPISNTVHPSVHETYQNLFNVSDEVYILTCSQLCQVLQVYRMCLRLEIIDYSYSSNLTCTPSMPGSLFNIGTCNFRWTLTLDYVRSQFYITYLAGEHTHGIEHGALKCGVDPSVFGVTKIRPRTVLPVKRRVRPEKRKHLRGKHNIPTFKLTLSLLEMANCAEAVDIPDDPSFNFRIGPNMTDKGFLASLKDKYFMRVKPNVVHPSIHKIFAQTYYIKHQIYCFTVSQLCQLFLAYRDCFWLRTVGLPRKDDVLQIIVRCSIKRDALGCEAPNTLRVDREKQVIYWRKVGDPLVIQKHAHSYEETIRKAGYKLQDLTLDLEGLLENTVEKRTH
ncbi:unnamed protein product [Ambrosiozyma monospora]|uniref:Unnamed protein product n=1 Tax=Ambrosiozyma monospora TaxID=43982 RepID=A0A9W6Z3T1_AMBMO|nr:unnamed protein product [Ambrosiozyma monospora]